jgi:hypothetical protein
MKNKRIKSVAKSTLKKQKVTKKPILDLAQDVRA